MKNILLLAALALVTTAAVAQAPLTDRQKAREARAQARLDKAAAKAAKAAKAAAPTAVAAPAPTATAAPMAADAPVAAPAYAMPTKSAEERAASKSRQLVRELGISAEQAGRLVPILIEQNKTVDALKEKANAEGKSKTISMAMRAANDQADEKMKAVLSPEQFAAFVKAREERNAAKKAAANQPMPADK